MRSASVEDELPTALRLQWTREYPPLEPAWPDEPRMRFDVSYQPVVAGDSVFIASPRSDYVSALSLHTGAEKWRFYADGPIRFAPVVHGDRLYFTCDDGYLYCLNAADGTVVWKFAGAPKSRMVLGNARLISSWPARGAPIIADGKVYFAAGIWPFMGIFIYALDAETGEVIWVNDGSGSNFISQPHGGAWAFAGVAPQGYIVVSGNRLIIPNGRSVPAVFDRDTGELLYFHLAENKREGNYAASATGELFFNSGRVYQLDKGTPPGLLPSDPIPTRNAIYAAKDGNVVAYAPQTAEVRTRKDDGEYKALELDTLWQAEVGVDRLWLKAGSQLIASAGNKLLILPLTADGVRSDPIWQAELPGQPSAVVTADGNLLVATLDGTIRRFGPRQIEPHHHSRQPADVSGGQTAAALARDMISRAGVTGGYCLCLGIRDGDLIAELARQSDMHIIGVDPRPDRIQSLRRRFAAAGIYGTRIALLCGDPQQIGLPPYIASLIVSEDLAAAGLSSQQAFVSNVFNSLRPYGGVACLPLSAQQYDEFRQWTAAADLAQAQLRLADGIAVLQRVGRLPGSDDWTHQYGDVANTATSTDNLVKAPLGLLWFGGSSNTAILPRHGHGPPEQVIGGRLFIEGPDSLRAMDVYTGRVLWERELPGFGAPYDYTGHQPGANALGTNYVCAEDAVYAAHQDHCLVLDPATGETLSKIVLPPAGDSTDPQAWGYIGIYDNLLIAGASPVIFDGEKPIGRDGNWDATSSQQIVVMDRHTGQVLWTHDSQYCFRHNAICAGDDRLFCIDRLPDAIVAKMKRRGSEPDARPILSALDIRTGETLWSTDKDVFGTFLSYSQEYDLLLQAGRPSRDMLPNEPGDRMIVYRGEDGAVVWDEGRKYSGPPLLHHNTIITQGQAFSLLTGERENRRNPITGVEMPWSFQRFYGCNTAIASEHLLTFRSGAAGFYDLMRDSGTGNFGGFKSGCTSNLVVANGVLNAPDYTRTCTCSYQNQTSLALVHTPDADIWTFNNLPIGDEPITRIGINFGAPGDRQAANGTLWLDYPSVGGPSPELPVTLQPEKPKPFRRHSSAIDGDDYAWVGASGLEGLRTVTITMAPDDTTPETYTVTLYFAEPTDIAAGQRVFSVAIQGRTVLEQLDVVAAAGAPRRIITRRFPGIQVDRDLTIELTRRQPQQPHGTLLCGIEVVAQNE